MKVVCVNVGSKYQGYDYVGKLYRALMRNTTQPFEFECIAKSKYPGWWAKLEIFPPKERTIFLDLDTIIVENIDFLFEYQGQFAILRDFYRNEGYGSAIMSIAPGFGGHVRETFEANAKEVMGQFYGDQNFLETQIQGADLWQDMYPGKIKSFKAHNLENGPDGAAIVCFHGFPKNHDVAHLGWVQEHWR